MTRGLFINDFPAQVDTFATDVHTSGAGMKIQHMFLLLATEGAAIRRASSFSCRVSLLLLFSISSTDQANTLVTDVDTSRSCNEALDLILVLATERANVCFVCSLRIHHGYVSPHCLIAT